MITRKTTVGEAVKDHPEVIPVLSKFGLSCVGCSVQYFETLEQGAQSHGMSESDIDRMIEESNTKIIHHDASPEAIDLSASAVKKIGEFLKSEKKEGSFFRIEVIEGGCSGLSYKFSIVDTKKDEDKVFSKESVSLLVDQKSFNSIKGSSIEYVDTIHGSGFKIVNPNVSNTCGCGNSFS